MRMVAILPRGEGSRLVARVSVNRVDVEDHPLRPAQEAQPRGVAALHPQTATHRRTAPLGNCVTPAAQARGP